ncbi:MAG: endonuclease III, partial [Veillonella caviae]|nr:endonuclease III [Veillonella caviae]
MRVTKAIKSEQIHILETVYKDAKVALDYNNPFELLVAVVLSAQCTDERVNIITKRLFPAYDHPAKMLALGVPKLEVLIRDCGLYRAKAANLIKTCQILLEKYHGEVPEQFDELVTLPGVGRKTANVLISVLFNTPAIAVDTHVFRVSERIGLTTGSKSPLHTEKTLMKHLPADVVARAHHWL